MKVKKRKSPSVSEDCLGAVGFVWFGPGPANLVHWDSERGWSLIHCLPAPAGNPVGPES